MNKKEFLEELRKGLAGLPQEDVEERLTFYCEMIDDRIEEGLTEEEAVAQIGPIGDIVSQTLSDIPLSKLVKEKMPKRSLRAWEIVLLVLGFPLWFALLVAAFAVVLALYIVVWALVIALWAVEVAFAVAAVACVPLAVFYAVKGNVPAAVAFVGSALLLAGLAIFLAFGCVAASKGAVKLARLIGRGVKRLFVRKENTK
ncbi:MAG: DUF1700 domain-containing protein [Clostridia bacterium]|nr:DUF1700 domain-containing protein [Clostridia bacterium]